MNKKQLFGTLILIGLFMAFAACAKPPTEEIDAANAALERAEENADAREYAPESLNRARSLVERMQSAVDEEDYDSAETLAIEAVSAAEQAIEDGAAAKEKARGDASSAIESAKTLLREVEQSFNAARDVRGIALDISSIRDDIDAASDEIATAEDEFQEASYAAAENTARNARSALGEIQSKIADAVQAATRRK